MTAARQQRKQCPVLAAVLGLGLAGGILTPSAAPAANDDRTVVNVNTGLAISGFDPVAYFTDSKPTSGRADLELSQGGVVWRFSNEGNRAEFAAHPDVYTPRFGGYDPVAVSRGTSVPGHPMFWAVVTGRLYLFYSAAAREAFVIDPGRIIETAERKWPEVARTIGR
jgi:YHS domain-containing protein